MQIGILALALVFLLSGAKNLQNSGFFPRSEKTKEQLVFLRRRFGFGLLLLLVGVFVFIYYVVTRL